MKIKIPVYFYCLMLSCIGTAPVFGQNQKRLDSLKNAIRVFDAHTSDPESNDLKDTIEVRLLNNLVAEYSLGNSNDGYPYAIRQLELSEKLNYNWGIASAANSLGAIYDQRGDYTTAIRYYSKSLKIKQKIHDKLGLVDSYNNIGICYSKLGNSGDALIAMQKGLEIAKNNKDAFGIFGSYNNIGIVYRDQGLYDKALSNYLTCLTVQLRSDQSFKVGETYSNIGDLYLLEHKPDQALTYLQRGLMISLNGKDTESAADNYSGLAQVYFQKKDFAKAFEIYKRVLELSTQTENTLGIANANLQIGYSCFKLGRNPDAVSFVTKGLNSLRLSGELEYIKTGYQYLSEIYSATGDYKKAFDNHVLYMKFQDSIRNMEQNKKFKELEVKYDLKSVRDQAKLKETVSAKELQLQKKIRYYIFGGMLLIVIFLIIVLIQRNKIAKIQRQKELEDERNRISRDLHDNLGAQLSTARMFISSLKNKNPADENVLDTSLRMLDSSIGDLRKIMHEMHPSVLQKKGYLVATEELVTKINHLHLIQFTLSHHNIESRFDYKIEHELFRITQELVNNTLKYAEARHISIELIKRDGKLVFMYEDDGKGFDVETVKRGNGLNNLTTRTKTVNGTIEFDATPAAGSRTIIEIPL